MMVSDIYRVYGQSQKGGRIYIGGVDATKFATPQGFNQYFRQSYDPSYAEAVPLADISNYKTESAGVGLLNIYLDIKNPFNIPSSVFNSGSGSSIIYYIDPNGYSKNIGGRSFQSQNVMTNFLVKGITELGFQWGTSTNNIDYLDFEKLKILNDYSFYNNREGYERLNIRNADTLGVADFKSNPHKN